MNNLPLPPHDIEPIFLAPADVTTQVSSPCGGRMSQPKHLAPAAGSPAT